MARKKGAQRTKITSTAELLPGLVQDWGGFEQFTAQLNRTAENVRVEHNVELVDRAGVPRRIDVVLRYREGLVDHLVLIECKFWKKNVSREKVDAFAQTIRELNASHGIIFSAVGFQSGAVASAEANGISLFKVREPSTGEWGAPGRVVDIYLTVVGRAVGSIAFPSAMTFASVENTDLRFDLHLGGDSATNTSVILSDGSVSTLEEQITLRSFDAARQIYALEVAKGVPFLAHNGTRRVWRSSTTIFFPLPLRPVAHPNVLIPAIQMQVGVEILQSRIVVDRAKAYTFVVAIEDCVTKNVTGATRRPGEELTSMFPLETRVDAKDAIQNGSVISAWVRDLQAFDKFSLLNEGQVEDSDVTDVAVPPP